MLNVSIDNDYIRTAYNKFISRMDPEILESFEGFLKTVQMVDCISSNNSATGSCNFEFADNAYHYGVASIELSKSKCLSLSEAALIGVIAHEFGHLEDRMFNATGSESFHEDAEAAANAHACYWGFKDEIMQLYKEMNYKYEEIPNDVEALDEENITNYFSMRRIRLEMLKKSICPHPAAGREKKVVKGGGGSPPMEPHRE